MRVEKFAPKPTDNWCTPRWLTDRLPMVTIDPCSNSASTVKAAMKFDGNGLGDGLVEDWGNWSVFVNPPYSRVGPWAERARASRAEVLLLVKLDPTTRWWGILMDGAANYYPFRKRIKFDPGPGLDAGTVANFPSALVLTGARRGHFSLAIEDMINDGVLWER